MPLPSNVSYGLVVFQLVQAVGDGDDADRFPDSYPSADVTITFIPSTPWVRNAAATPNPVTIYLQKIIGSTDGDGYLVDASGTKGVYLVATDDTDLQPSFNYQVQIAIPGEATRTFPIQVPGGGTVDLTLVAP